MKIYILPVSGGGFVVQLAIIQHLCEIKYVPDLCLASSGGNVAAYISAAADWKWPDIIRISRDLNHELFAKKWSSIALISFMVGFFQGNLYAKGTGVESFLHKYFDKEKIIKHEIWTGTYNRNHQRAQLFCNKSFKTSILNKYKMNHNLTQSMDNIYANGDIDLLAKASLASASIPGMVPPQTINNEDYTDGGNFGASPLTIMKGSIINYITDTNKSVHLTYINSVNLNDIENSNSFNVIDIWKQATEDLIKSFSVFDRLAAYEILKSQSNEIKHVNFPCNYAYLKMLEKVYKLTKYTLLEIYPKTPLEINITSFTGKDVIDGINKAYDNCLCRFWWVTVSNNVNSQIFEIFSNVKVASENIVSL